MLFAISGEPWMSLIALMLAGIADMLDGVVARRLDLGAEDQRFGAQLDSVIDALSFGAAPAVFYYLAFPQLPLALTLCFVHLFSVVWRLSRFAVVGATESQEGQRTYQGLPCTYVALTLPGSAAVALCDPMLAPWALGSVGLLTALFMLSRVSVPRPGRLGMILLILLAITLGGFFTAARMRDATFTPSKRAAPWR